MCFSEEINLKVSLFSVFLKTLKTLKTNQKKTTNRNERKIFGA